MPQMEQKPAVTLLREELSSCLERRGDGSSMPEGKPCGAEKGIDALPTAVSGYLRNKTDLAALSPHDLVSFSTYCHLGFYRTLALILKGEWEWYVSMRLPEGKAIEGVVGEGLASLRELSGGFKASMERGSSYADLYRLLESGGVLAEAGDCDEKELRNIISHMILADIHLFAGNSPELDSFIAAEETQRRLLKGASPLDAEGFWKKKRIWIELENEVGGLLLKLEEQTLRNRKSQREWMAVFGRAYIPLVEAEYLFDSLSYRIARKSEDPSLTVQQLDELEEENRLAEKEHIAKLKKSAVALKRDLTGPGSIPPDDDEIDEYEKECKKILRKIWRLTHPDAIDRERFTAEQKNKLRAYFEEAVPYQDGGRLEDEEITLAMRSLVILKELLAKVEAVWKSMGMDCNEQSVIQGETLTEQSVWLDQRIASLEEEANQVRVELMAAVDDPEFREMDACLVSAEQISAITAEMEAKLNWYKERNLELERELAELFEE